MAEEKLFNDPNTFFPVDLSENEAWLGGQQTYELGVCTFRVLGYNRGRDSKKEVGFVHEIIDGPEGVGDGHANKGKRITRTFGLDKRETKNFLKGYLEAIGGKENFDGGKQTMKVIIGTVFKANIFSRSYESPDKNDPSKKTARTAFEFDLNTVEIISRGQNGTQQQKKADSSEWDPK